jgi:hypothetical protein
MERDDLAWSGQSWRLPPWLWLSLAAMVAGTLHILLDASVGLFPARGSGISWGGPGLCAADGAHGGGFRHERGDRAEDEGPERGPQAEEREVGRGDGEGDQGPEPQRPGHDLGQRLTQDAEQGESGDREQQRQGE